MTRSRLPRISAEAVAWILLVVGLTLAFGDVVAGPWDHDSGMYLLHASYVADGMHPYLDYSSIYPPLMDLVTAAPIAIGLNRLLLLFAIPTFWILANTLLSGVLAFRLTGDRAAATICAAVFPLFVIENHGNHVTLEHPVVFFTLLAVIVILGEMTPMRWALAGACCAAAVLSKQVGAIAVLPVAAIAIERRSEFSRRHLFAFLGGTAAVGLALLAWLQFRIATIYRNIVHDLTAYARAMPLAGWPHEFARAPETAWLFVLGILAAAALIARAPRHRWLAAAALVGGIIEFVPYLIRDYPHYLLNVWPFLAIVAGLALSQWRSWTIAALLILAAPAYVTTTIAGGSVSSPLLMTTFVPAATTVASVTPPAQPVRQYGSEPVIEFLSNRRQERIDWGTSVFSTWSGDELYHTPAVHGRVTIVIVDLGDTWTPAARNDTLSRGFKLVAKFGTKPRVEIYR